MLQREIRLKEVQDATYDDMCRLLNERKLCNVERCTGMGKTTIFLRYIREHPDETVLYFYDTDDIKNKIKLRLMVKMSCSCPIRNSLEQQRALL